MVCTGLMSLIEISDEIFIIWVFHDWLEIVLLILKSYWCNDNCFNCVRLIDIEHVQLKLLTSKNDLILVGILGVLFIARTIASTVNEGINDTVDCSWSIDDIEIKLWEELISVGLMMIQLMSNDEVFQILVINEHNYRVSSIIDFRTLFFKCLNNDQ